MHPFFGDYTIHQKDGAKKSKSGPEAWSEAFMSAGIYFCMTLRTFYCFQNTIIACYWHTDLGLPGLGLYCCSCTECTMTVTKWICIASRGTLIRINFHIHIQKYFASAISGWYFSNQIIDVCSAIGWTPYSCSSGSTEQYFCFNKDDQDPGISNNPWPATDHLSHVYLSTIKA